MIFFNAQPGVLRKRVQLCAIALLCATGMAQAESCRAESFRGASYAVCSFNPVKDHLRTFWRGNDGNPFRTFDALAADLEAKGKWLRFAMNGGMYRGDLNPVGLYIENGRVMVPPNTVTLTGAQSQIPNFYKKPNGVFYIGEGRAGILETGRFLAEKPEANFATQSGPMLLINGKIHPAFIVNSTDRKPRDGVGLSSQNEIYFVITESWVSFYDFARFFRDRLGCSNALFLDGARRLGYMRRSSAVMMRPPMAAMGPLSRWQSSGGLPRHCETGATDRTLGKSILN